MVDCVLCRYLSLIETEMICGWKTWTELIASKAFETEMLTFADTKMM